MMSLSNTKILSDPKAKSRQGPENIIIGAGISGLACGWQLRDCLILEKEPHIGGLCHTVEFKGLRFDLGGHRFFTHHKQIESFFSRLLAGKLLKVKRKSKIYRHKKFIHYPLRVSIIFQLSPLEITLSFFTYIYRKLFPRQAISFEDNTINRFGDHLYRMFFKNYTQKAWGLPCKSISQELAMARLQNISLLRVIKHALIKDNTTKSFAASFLYPEYGISMLPGALSQGLRIKLNSEVTGLVYSKDKIEKVIINGSQELPCENLISTMPLTNLLNFFAAPSHVRKAAGNLKYRSLVCIFLILDEESFSENHWIYFPGEQIFARLHEPKNWSGCMAPKQASGVCLEIFCDKDDELWRKSDAELAGEAISDLSRINPLKIKDYQVLRLEYAYPQYDLSYKNNLEIVKTYLSSYRNLFILGRTGAFSYSNIDACLIQGLELGRYLSYARIS